MAVSGRDAQPSAPAPNIQLSTVQPGKAAAPVGAVGSPVASFSISNDSSLEPLAFCANNAPLAGSENSRRASECRAYMYIIESDYNYFSCSAWFVRDKTHVVTAGHCVAKGGTGTYLVHEFDGAFGIVCCNPAPSDLLYDCAYDAQFYITGVVAPNEWVYQGNDNNDGAVMRVNPSPNTNPGFGVALPTGSISADPCIERDILWGGFQSKSDLQQDCGKLYSDKYLYRSSRAREAPTSCPPDNSGNVLLFPGSNCPGMSGGRLLDVATGNNVGLIFGSDDYCNSYGYSRVFFTQLVDTDIEGSGGICVAALVAAIP